MIANVLANGRQFFLLAAMVVGVSVNESSAAVASISHGSSLALAERLLDDNLGLAFYEPETREALRKLESGEFKAAESLLTEAMAEKGIGKKRLAELNLGLSMIYVRSAVWDKSSSRLNTLAKSETDSTVPARARALEAVRKYAKNNIGQSAKEEMATLSGWQRAVLGGKTQLWKDLEKKTEKLDRYVDKKIWSDADTLARDMYDDLLALAEFTLVVDDLAREEDRRDFSDDKNLEEMTKELRRVLDRVISRCGEHVAECVQDQREEDRKIQECEREKRNCRSEACIKAKEGSIRTSERAKSQLDRQIRDIKKWSSNFSRLNDRIKDEVGSRVANHNEDR